MLPYIRDVAVVVKNITEYIRKWLDVTRCHTRRHMISTIIVQNANFIWTLALEANRHNKHVF